MTLIKNIPVNFSYLKKEEVDKYKNDNILLINEIKQAFDGKVSNDSVNEICEKFKKVAEEYAGERSVELFSCWTYENIPKNYWEPEYKEGVDFTSLYYVDDCRSTPFGVIEKINPKQYDFAIIPEKTFLGSVGWLDASGDLYCSNSNFLACDWSSVK